MFDYLLIEDLMGVEARKTVERKRRGGDNNSKGADYEREYTLARILDLGIACLRSGDKGTDITLQAQACCFVDDLVIQFSNHAVFSQLKDSQTQTWSKLAEDCNSQQDLNEAARIAGNIEIVVSRSEVANHLRENLPAELSRVTVVHFSPPSPWEKDHIEALCEPFANRSALRVSRHHILAAWDELERHATLGSILMRASILSNGVIQSLECSYPLSREVRELLDGIADFTYATRGNTFHYAFPGGTGVLQYDCGSDKWFELEERLRLAPPSSFVEFFHYTRNIQ